PTPVIWWTWQLVPRIRILPRQAEASVFNRRLLSPLALMLSISRALLLTIRVIPFPSLATLFPPPRVLAPSPRAAIGTSTKTETSLRKVRSRAAAMRQITAILGREEVRQRSAVSTS